MRYKAVSQQCWHCTEMSHACHKFQQLTCPYPYTKFCQRVSRFTVLYFGFLLLNYNKNSPHLIALPPPPSTFARSPCPIWHILHTVRTRFYILCWHQSLFRVITHRVTAVPTSRSPLTFQSLLVTWHTSSLTFNNCTICPHCIYAFCIYLRTNSDLCHLQHKLIGFYNRDEKGLCAVRYGSLNKAVCASYLTL